MTTIVRVLSIPYDKNPEVRRRNPQTSLLSPGSTTRPKVRRPFTYTVPVTITVLLGDGVFIRYNHNHYRHHPTCPVRRSGVHHVSPSMDDTTIDVRLELESRDPFFFTRLRSPSDSTSQGLRTTVLTGDSPVRVVWTRGRRTTTYVHDRHHPSP